MNACRERQSTDNAKTDLQKTYQQKAEFMAKGMNKPQSIRSARSALGNLQSLCKDYVSKEIARCSRHACYNDSEHGSIRWGNV